MQDRTESGQSVDVLAEILDTIHLQEATVRASAVDGELPCDGGEPFHVDILIALEGQVAVRCRGTRIEMERGDALALVRAEPAREPGVVLRYSGIECSDGPTPFDARGTVLHCSCRFASQDKNPLLNALPPIMRIDGQNWVQGEWLSTALEWLKREVSSEEPGARVVVNRLVELVWIQLIRAHIATSPAATHGWLRALSDAQIGGALALIHEQPATEFTVAGLAQAVGMSRSAFASQFTRLVGEPPLHYVARWRMLKASQLLKEERQTLAEVAVAVGYDSEAAFSKAFKRWCGQAPGSYRREMRRESLSVVPMMTG